MKRVIFRAKGIVLTPIGIIGSIIADTQYMIWNIKKFGFSWELVGGCLDYMIENIVNPTRERIQN